METFPNLRKPARARALGLCNLPLALSILLLAGAACSHSIQHIANRRTRAREKALEKEAAITGSRKLLWRSQSSHFFAIPINLPSAKYFSSEHFRITTQSIKTPLLLFQRVRRGRNLLSSRARYSISSRGRCIANIASLR